MSNLTGARPPCPLCKQAASEPFHTDHRRPYLRCPTCSLVFVPPTYHLSVADEKAEYDRHENSPDDRRYREFLRRVLDPVRARVAPGSRGLDFGSGPDPTLSVMFEELGHPMAIYDPLYADDPAALARRYDFITATEVFEHLRDPGTSLAALWACLEPGGVLAAMTQLVRDHDAFTRWRYTADPTHVCFFSRATFEWLAARWQATAAFLPRGVVVLGKRAESDCGR